MHTGNTQPTAAQMDSHKWWQQPPQQSAQQSSHFSPCFLQFSDRKIWNFTALVGWNWYKACCHWLGGTVLEGAATQATSSTNGTDPEFRSAEKLLKWSWHTIRKITLSWVSVVSFKKGVASGYVASQCILLHVNARKLKTGIIRNLLDYHKLSGLSSLKASCEMQAWHCATQHQLFLKTTGFLWLRNWGKLQHGREARTGHHILIAIEVDHWVRLQMCHTLRDCIQLCLPQRCLPRLCLGNLGLRCRETHRSCC